LRRSAEFPLEIRTVPVDHYENFPVASLLLPRALRDPIEVIYRFARSADDFADEGNAPAAERLAQLQAYRDELARIAANQPTRLPLFSDVARIAREHSLPLGLFADLLSAFSQDVTTGRYADFAQLLDYCRRSANPIGRLLLHLFRQTSADDLAQSDAICSALQLINFWQDVPIDYAKGRIYLPQDRMRAHGVAEAHIAEGRCDDAWRALLASESARARALLVSGAPLGRRLPGRMGLEIRTTVQGGLRVLDKLRAVGYDMFRHRPVLRGLDWPLLLWRAI
jgi:squalene synthase HpnC